MGDNTHAKHTQLVDTSASGTCVVSASMIFGTALTVALSLLSLILTWQAAEPNPLPLMLAAWCLMLLLWSPTSFQPLYNAWNSLWLAVGRTLIMLVWVCYILPAGLIMQARGKDPLHLRFRPEARTYWKKPLPIGDMKKSA